MADYAVKCSCGHSTIVSEWALGAPLKCRNCGRSLEATERNTRPVDEPSKRPAREAASESELPESPEARILAKMEAARARGATTGPAAPARKNAPSPPLLPPEAVPGAAAEPPPVTTSNCARCGRTFRGDWDRYRRSEGVLCHVCANQYREEEGIEPEPVPVGPAQAATIPSRTYQGVLDHPVLPDPDRPRPEDVREYNEIIRQVVIVAGVVMLIVTGVVLATGILDSDVAMSPTLDPVEGQDLPPMPAWAIPAVLAVRCFFDYVTILAALYFVLWWMRELPNDSFWANVLALSIVVAPITLLGIALAFVPYIGLVLFFFARIYILYKVYDLDLLAFLGLFVFAGLIYPLVAYIERLAYGVIGLIAF